MAARDRTKYFTLEQANATLPYVRSIVADIMTTYQEWRDRVGRYEVLAANSRSDLGETDEQVALRKEVDDYAARIDAFLEELNAVGCVFKGFDEGLVDFKSQIFGRDVFLCWKYDEPEIRFWHELDAGFAGRQELLPELVTGDSK